jgi:hypothetical protein
LGHVEARIEGDTMDTRHESSVMRHSLLDPFVGEAPRRRHYCREGCELNVRDCKLDTVEEMRR